MGEYMTTAATGIVCGERFLDHAAFCDASARAAAGFAALGLEPGDTVGILMRNDIEFLVAQSAAAKVGAYAVPLNWHARTDEIGYVLSDAGAKALVAHADLLETLRAAIPKQCRVLAVETPADVLEAHRIDPQLRRVAEQDIDWTAWRNEHAPLVDARVEGSASLGIHYTSGTTGRPKGVMRDPVDAAGAERMLSVADEIFGVGRDEPVRVLVSAPVYHGAPNFFANRGTQQGCLSVLQTRFAAEQVLQLVARHRITHLYLVPTTMIKLLDLPADIKARYDLSSLRRVVHSAAPCPSEVKARMIEWLGPVVFEFYGGTETGAVTLLSSEEALRKPGSVGRLLSNCGLKVYDDRGRELPPGEIGEIYARNFNLPRFKYRHLPEKQAEVERDDLVSIGDVGYIDREGFVFLCDRKRDLVISAGVNIYPAQIEAVLLGMPEVADCIVFGTPDATYGEALCAHVQPKPGVALSAGYVLEYLRARLASYQVPRTVVIDERLPREESGKIMKRKVRDRYWANSGRMI